MYLYVKMWLVSNIVKLLKQCKSLFLKYNEINLINLHLNNEL